SLAAIHARSLDGAILPRLLSAILRQFESILGRLVEEEPSLPAEWNRLDRLRDRWVSVDLGARVVSGWGQGIDDHGELCLDDGRQRRCVYGGQVLRNPVPSIPDDRSGIGPILRGP